MSHRFEANEEHLRPFNLLPFQLRIIDLAHIRNGVSPHEVEQTCGSWSDLMTRGLLQQSGALLYPTVVGTAFYKAIELLSSDIPWV